MILSVDAKDTEPDDDAAQKGGDDQAQPTDMTTADVHAEDEPKGATGGNYPLEEHAEEDYGEEEEEKEEEEEEEEEEKEGEEEEEGEQDPEEDLDFEGLIASGHIKMKVHASG